MRTLSSLARREEAVWPFPTTTSNTARGGRVRCDHAEIWLAEALYWLQEGQLGVVPLGVVSDTRTRPLFDRMTVRGAMSPLLSHRVMVAL